MFTPQRFVEQVVAFEYLFDKLDHKNAQNPKYPLKNELKGMFNEFPQLLSQTKLSAEKVSDQIRKLDALLLMDMHITTISKMTQTPNI